MEDYTSNVLTDSKNEWSILLMNYLTPHVIDGFRSIFNESVQLCEKSDELEKYLMTFQNLLSRIPKWNNEMIRIEKERIMKLCNCSYLEDLMTCVHIIQLKILSCVRVGNDSKKITIDIPDFGSFLHKVYINVARKVYSNVYLFEKNITPLQAQKNNRELEIIIQECILLAIRESIPTEAIIRAYMDESVEQEEEVIIENIEDPTPEPVKAVGGDVAIETPSPIKAEEDLPSVVPTIQNIDSNDVVTRLTFNDIDSILDDSNKVEAVSAPKSIERLEEISTSRAIARKLEEEEESAEDKIQIHTDHIDLSGFDILDELDSQRASEDVLLNDIEEL